MARLVLAYLFRRPVQVLAMFGVAVGLGALLVVLSVMNGLIEKDRESARGPLSDLLLLPPITDQAAQFAPYREALLAQPEIAAVAPHLMAFAVLGLENGSAVMSNSSSSDVNGVQVVGIDTNDEIAASGFGDSLRRSRLYPVPDPDNPFSLEGVNGISPTDRMFPRPGVLVSDALAGLIGLRPGERIQLGALPPRLPPGDEPLQPHNGTFLIVGTYSGLDYDLDMDRIYMQRTGTDGLHFNLVGHREAGDFSEVLIDLADGVSFADGKAAVTRALSGAGLPLPGGSQGGEIQTWEERRSLYLTAIENERRVTGLVMFFIVIVAAFGLFATLSALVREKVRDLGILSALGYTPMRRGALLLTVGATGSLFGTLLGVAGAWWLVDNHLLVERKLDEWFGITIFEPGLYVIDGLPAQWDSSQALLFSALAFLVGCAFTLGPAMHAASMPPTQALRYE